MSTLRLPHPSRLNQVLVQALAYLLRARLDALGIGKA